MEPSPSIIPAIYAASHFSMLYSSLQFNKYKKECMFVSIVLKPHYDFNYLEKWVLSLSNKAAL